MDGEVAGKSAAASKKKRAKPAKKRAPTAPVAEDSDSDSDDIPLCMLGKAEGNRKASASASKKKSSKKKSSKKKAHRKASPSTTTNQPQAIVLAMAMASLPSAGMKDVPDGSLLTSPSEDLELTSSLKTLLFKLEELHAQGVYPSTKDLCVHVKTTKAERTSLADHGYITLLRTRVGASLTICHQLTKKGLAWLATEGKQIKSPLPTTDSIGLVTGSLTDGNPEGKPKFVHTDGVNANAKPVHILRIDDKQLVGTFTTKTRALAALGSTSTNRISMKGPDGKLYSFVDAKVDWNTLAGDDVTEVAQILWEKAPIILDFSEQIKANAANKMVDRLQGKDGYPVRRLTTAGEYCGSHLSASTAATWLIENGKTDSHGSAKTMIARAIRDQTASFGYLWEWERDETRVPGFRSKAHVVVKDGKEVAKVASLGDAAFAIGGGALYDDFKGTGKLKESNGFNVLPDNSKSVAERLEERLQDRERHVASKYIVATNLMLQQVQQDGGCQGCPCSHECCKKERLRGTSCFTEILREAREEQHTLDFVKDGYQCEHWNNASKALFNKPNFSQQTTDENRVMVVFLGRCTWACHKHGIRKTRHMRDNFTILERLEEFPDIVNKEIDELRPYLVPNIARQIPKLVTLENYNDKWLVPSSLDKDRVRQDPAYKALVRRALQPLRKNPNYWLNTIDQTD
jgi:hypothetical protein